MSTDSQYTIRPYTHADNVGLAVMWNESDDQWPGTFTHGVPLTEERVAEWMNREATLLRLVAQDDHNGAIAGYGTLWDDKAHAKTCYVDLLNVAPAHQGRSLARRILTQMVDYATEQGYDRMTIATWSANLYAMPLYKKVGYFWIPETQVYMESLLPAIRRLAVAKPFFKRHDWYRTYQRTLEQTEDDERHPATEEMKVYVCRWAEDGDSLEVVIDRQAQAITGLATEEFSAYAVVKEIEPAQGFSYPINWRITNRKEESISFTILAQGDDGIDLTHHASFVLAPGEERTIEATYRCPIDGPPLDLDEHKATPSIRTTLVAGDQVVELASGLRYRPAIEFSTEPAYPSLLPGREQVVNLRLYNQAKRPLHGAVIITPQQGMETNWVRREMQVEADGYLDLPVRVTCRQSGPLPLSVSAVCEVDGAEIETAPHPLLLLATDFGGVSAANTADYGASHGKEVIVAENDLFQAIGRPKGGRCTIVSKSTLRHQAQILEEAGPVFEPEDLSETAHRLSVRMVDGAATLTFTASSSNFPGVTVSREVTISASPIIRIVHRVVNNGHSAYKLWIKPFLSLSDREGASVALPHRERLIEEPGDDFPNADGDLPKQPHDLAEQWYALTENGQVAGAIWTTDIVEHESFWGWLHLHYAEVEIQPQCSQRFGPLYLYVGPGSWQDVRHTWRRLAGLAKVNQTRPIETKRPHNFSLTPTPLLTVTDKVDAQLRVDSTRERPLSGEISIKAPDGWASDDAAFVLADVQKGKPFETSIQLVGSAREPTASAGRLELRGEVEDESSSLTIIRLGTDDKPVSITERKQADQALWEIDNGHSAWTIAPDYQAGVIEWRDRERDVNHLLTTFPEPGELSWMSPLLGGLRPSMSGSNGGQDFPGKLHDEQFKTTSIEAVDNQGIAWQGVQLSTVLTRDKLAGLCLDLTYLTVGGSNVLKVVYGIHNETRAWRRITPRLLGFVGIDGRHDNSVVHGETLQRKRTARNNWPTAGRWSVIENPESGRAMAMVAGSSQRDIKLMNWGLDGGHFLLSEGSILVPSDSAYEIVVYLALADSVDAARRYKALSGVV